MVSFYLVAYDVVAVTLSYFLALLIRFDFQFSRIPTVYFQPWAYFAPVYAAIAIVVFWRLRLYNSIWRFASFKELERVTLATVITTIIHIVGVTIVLNVIVHDSGYTLGRMPISYYVMGAMIQFMLTTGVRFSYRYILLLRSSKQKENLNRIALVGAGAAGRELLADLRRSPQIEEQVVCFIDDNKNKWGRDIDGIPVVGGRDSIIETVRDMSINKIYIALPSVSARERKRIIDICRQTDCEIMNLPGMYQLALGDVTVSSLRKVDVEDLLGREPVKMNSREVRESLEGKVVLITGGGGSIGSELCRQVAKAPGLKQLIIFDIYENNAHAIKLELMDKYPDLDLVTLIGSVRNSRKLKQVFHDYKPDIVFHAAAHKHVPLMEDSPCEAIKNNVMGTYYTAFAAMAYDCEKFVLISTDKAVNPVNIMGASKRLCEMIIQSFAKKIAEDHARDIPDMHTDSNTFLTGEDEGQIRKKYTLIPPEHPRTEFVAVRFGNVLGSNGSVIPRFREQIAAGGPVTVTHPDIIRYFMTIPEAASLVLQASTFTQPGRIFVLDMGTPVKIDDLARNMIKLSGLKPDEDIQVVYTGLRPGEKLFEERLMDEEGLSKTSNQLISIGKPIPFDEDKFIDELPSLFDAAYEDREDIREIVEQFVSTYHPAGKHGTEDKGEAYEHQMMEMLAKKTPKL
ncbi:MAG: polysaccharide biosynthesis protein [Firmicutes bacterium]|nr:polysaccharide biosynthesis protein [Bacillota bacterium]